MTTTETMAPKLANPKPRKPREPDVDLSGEQWTQDLDGPQPPDEVAKSILGVANPSRPEFDGYAAELRVKLAIAVLSGERRVDEGAAERAAKCVAVLAKACGLPEVG